MDMAAPPSDQTDPKSPRVGKVQHPCGAPDNHLLTIWSPGATNNANGPAREPIHSGIYLIRNGEPIWEPGAMLKIKHDADFNAQWPPFNDDHRGLFFVWRSYFNPRREGRKGILFAAPMFPDEQLDVLFRQTTKSPPTLPVLNRLYLSGLELLERIIRPRPKLA